MPLGPPRHRQRTSRSRRMSPEGSEVTKGDQGGLLRRRELERDLLERAAERDSAAKEIERKLHDSSCRSGRASCACTRPRRAAQGGAQGRPARQVHRRGRGEAGPDRPGGRRRPSCAWPAAAGAQRAPGRGRAGLPARRHARFAARGQPPRQAHRFQWRWRRPSTGWWSTAPAGAARRRRSGDDCWWASPAWRSPTSEMEAQGEVDEIGVGAGGGGADRCGCAWRRCPRWSGWARWPPAPQRLPAVAAQPAQGDRHPTSPRQDRPLAHAPGMQFRGASRPGGCGRGAGAGGRRSSARPKGRWCSARPPPAGRRSRCARAAARARRCR
jgi:hypothetical protein